MNLGICAFHISLLVHLSITTTPQVNLEFPSLPSRKPFLIDLVHDDHLYTAEQGGKASGQVGNHTHPFRSGWESIPEETVQREEQHHLHFQVVPVSAPGNFQMSPLLICLILRNKTCFILHSLELASVPL